MQLTECLMSHLLRKTEAREYRQFKLLQSWREYSDARKIRYVEKLIISSLKQSTKSLFKDYCKAIKAGETDAVKLMAYCTAKDVLAFCEKDLLVLSDMIDEYECYLAAGNWLDFVFSSQRPVDKLHDYRG